MLVLKNQAEKVREVENKDNRPAASVFKGGRASIVTGGSLGRRPLHPVAFDMDPNALMHGIGDLFEDSINMTLPQEIVLA